jgi:hypothetical protein
MLLATWCLLFTLSLNSYVWAQSKKVDPVILPVGEVGGMKVLAGFENITEYKNTLIGAALLFICREVYQFIKDRANKTGEKVTHIDNRITKMEEKIDAFIRAQEKAEDRLERRVARLEGER